MVALTTDGRAGARTQVAARERAGSRLPRARLQGSRPAPVRGPRAPPGPAPSRALVSTPVPRLLLTRCPPGLLAVPGRRRSISGVSTWPVPSPTSPGLGSTTRSPRGGIPVPLYVGLQAAGSGCGCRTLSLNTARGALRGPGGGERCSDSGQTDRHLPRQPDLLRHGGALDWGVQHRRGAGLLLRAGL